jgi:hypothetical protein
MSLKRFLLVRFGRLISYPIRRQLRKFEVACETPEVVQTGLLLSILRKQQATAFGRDHTFASVRSVADYRKAVPVKPYEYVAPYIERITKGETSALLSARRVHLFALTSGTTASRKLIPVTDDYLAAYKRGWNMWGIKMYRDNRGRRVAMRPIVQMAGDPEEFLSPAGIPCGNLSGYTAMVQKRLIRWMYAVPYVTGKIKDAKARYYVALRFSVGRNVSQFMAANPSTLVQFARTLDAEKESLLRDLRDGTLRTDLDIPADVRDFLTRRLPRDAKKAAQLAAVEVSAVPTLELRVNGALRCGRSHRQTADQRASGKRCAVVEPQDASLRREKVTCVLVVPPLERIGRRVAAVDHDAGCHDLDVVDRHCDSSVRCYARDGDRACHGPLVGLRFRVHVGREVGGSAEVAGESFDRLDLETLARLNGADRLVLGTVGVLGVVLREALHVGARLYCGVL